MMKAKHHLGVNDLNITSCIAALHDTTSLQAANPLCMHIYSFRQEPQPTREHL
jgi:hypothetical protein